MHDAIISLVSSTKIQYLLYTVLHPVLDSPLPYEEAAVRGEPAIDRRREEACRDNRPEGAGVREVYNGNHREGNKRS
jgi:hypothetical protein